MSTPAATRVALLTGATGYIGGRLLPALVARGLRVRCLARNPAFVPNVEGVGVEVVPGDVLDFESLKRAFTGVDTAYYLIHALGSSADFEAEEQRGAENFASAAVAAGVKRIIYLGGLGGNDVALSPHLRSRREVGAILQRSGVPTIELRASIVIGSGSLSFEMIRALVERLPAMITPRWVRVQAQPIAIGDLVQYLLAALDLPLTASRVFEIGGADVVSYRELMLEYARQRGLRRLMIAVPFLTPRLSSLWLGLVTPLYARTGRRLIDSMTSPSIVRDDAARREFPVRPMGMREAIAAALRNEHREFALTSWYDSVSSSSARRNWAGVRLGNRLLDARSIDINVPPERAFAPIAAIGGRRGWYAWNALWQLRGFADLLIGGVGMRRGHPGAARLRPGVAVDFWRVEAYEPGRLLRLSAEMRLPGRAWLEFEVSPRPGGATIRQTAMFDPLGVWGLLYWYLVYPFHRLIFDGMLRGIAKAAVRGEGSAPSLLLRPE